MQSSISPLSRQSAEFADQISGSAQNLAAPSHAAALRLCRLLSEVSLVYDRLESSVHETLLGCVETLEPLNADPAQEVNPDEAIRSAYALIAPHERAIRRLAAQVDQTRYINTQDLLKANALLRQGEPQADLDTLQRCADSARAFSPNASLIKKAAALWDAIHFSRPFAQMNDETATVAALAFLAANGAVIKAGENELWALHQNMASESSTAEAALPRSATLGVRSETESRTLNDCSEAIWRKYGAALLGSASKTGVQSHSPLPDEQKNELAPGVPYEEDEAAPRGGLQAHYLTPHDVIWINTETTRRVNDYSYVPLEEAIYHQYSYRISKEPLKQASRFLSALLQAKPFSAGNQRTALIAVLTFLNLNGFDVKLPVEDAVSWLTDVQSSAATALEAVSNIVRPHESAHLRLRPLVRTLIERYRPCFEQLD